MNLGAQHVNCFHCGIIIYNDGTEYTPIHILNVDDEEKGRKMFDSDPNGLA